MARAPIISLKLIEDAQAILTKNNMTYDGDIFRKEKTTAQFSWDRFYTHRFFTGPRVFSGCCGVIEMATCYPPVAARFPGVSHEEWKTLFHYHVRHVLSGYRRRMAVITLINSQKAMIPFVQYAGFNQVSTGFNPGTRRNVNLWALSI